jgi:DNA-binding transcriptional MerR regulator
VPSHTARQAAALSGFSLDTVRYYERIGLLPKIARTAAGRRVFSEVDLRWLELLRCLRDTGMPIAEMLQFVRLMNGGEATVSERAEVLTAHHQRVEDQITRLQGHLEQIGRKIDIYRGGEPWSLRTNDPDADAVSAPGSAITGARSSPRGSAGIKDRRDPQHDRASWR